MRCKNHAADLSSTAGVCASCLRERLFSLMAAQAQAKAQAEAHCNSDAHPEFSRSVSPYISRRKSVKSAVSEPEAASLNCNHHGRDRNRRSLSDQRFFSTPEVGQTAGDCDIGGEFDRKKKPSLIRFSSFSNLFRSKNKKEADPRVSVSNNRESRVGDGGGSAASEMSSPSCFSITSGGGRRKKRSTIAGAGVERKQKFRDRGMSPAEFSDDEFRDGLSGHDSPESRKQTPRRTPARRGGGGGHGRTVSGFAICLSPLVRASPNWHWNGMPAADGVFSSDNRSPARPHLSTAKSFCANRSRKFADFGRFNPNR